jgi:hypothetical protein
MDSYRNGFHQFFIIINQQLGIGAPVGWNYFQQETHVFFYRNKRLGLMMNKHTQKAFEMIEAARPASGYRPQTEAEWSALQAASVELGYAMGIESGKTDTHARQIAQLIYGGPAGRLLLEMAFKDDSHA